MTNVCERWAQDHTNALQLAWFNGVGFESWENVWGTWNGITARDGEQLRRLHRAMRCDGPQGPQPRLTLPGSEAETTPG